jgi:tRNA A-37 threonylcarbamoyl transferase component Bud32
VVSPCPPEDDLLAFSSGDLSQVERVTLLGHLAECDECRVVTSELSKARLGSAATAAHDVEGQVAPSPPVARVEAVAYERPPFLAFAPGEVLAGKFKVVKVLGAGGMGVVIEAEHLLLERRVALKFMGPELMADPEATARFLREAKAASLIPNEHVVKILDVDTLADGTPYIVMERLYGHDLASVIEREGRLEASRAVGYLLEAMEALAHAHAKGIVHRDLKPANLFLANREDGTTLVKVLDFGIAKSQDANGQSAGVTTSRTVLGSPRYMAPEQMQSAKAADMRADVWALGTILFELVSGRPAFEGETLAALTVAICAGPPPSLAAAFPSVSKALDGARASRPRIVPRFGRPHLGPLSEWPFGAGIGAPRTRRECSPARRCDHGSDRKDRCVVTESRRGGRGGGCSLRGWLGYPPLALGFACRAFAIFDGVRSQPPFGRAFAPRAARFRADTSRQRVRPNGRSRHGASVRKEACNVGEHDPFAFPPARAFGRASPDRVELAVRRAQVRLTRHPAPPNRARIDRRQRPKLQ